MPLDIRQESETNGMPEIVWRPQPGPQTALLSCPVPDIFFGGARGGGKTDAMLGGDWPQHAAQYGAAAKGIFLRKSLVQLEQAIARAKELYLPMGARFNEQKKRFTFPNGAVLIFAYLKKDSDAENYQGHSYTRVYIEEITNWSNSGPINKLRATLRSAQGVPTGFRATGNPGGAGHIWVKNFYVDPAPFGYNLITDKFGNQRIFIPSKVTDNQMLMKSDPTYVHRLHLSGSESLVRAWLEGDWSVIDGAFFDRWSPNNVIEPFTIPEGWTKFIAMDWGYAKPFSIGWYAVADGFHHGLPQGAMVRYREFYGCKFNADTGAVVPDTGLRMDAEEVRDETMRRNGNDKIAYCVADPAMWGTQTGPSIAERFINPAGKGIKVMRKADNTRITHNGETMGAVSGWNQMRSRIRGVKCSDNTVRPMLYCFKTHQHFLRTVPALGHDENRPEDLDTTMEDHIADECRYACSSRPMISKRPAHKPDPYAPQKFTDYAPDLTNTTRAPSTYSADARMGGVH